MKKFNTMKFSLVVASAMTFFMVVKKLFYRVFFCRMGMFGKFMQQSRYFIPGMKGQAKATIPCVWHWAYSLIGIVILFGVSFATAWLFAELYKKFVAKK